MNVLRLTPRLLNGRPGRLERLLLELCRRRCAVDLRQLNMHRSACTLLLMRWASDGLREGCSKRVRLRKRTWKDCSVRWLRLWSDIRRGWARSRDNGLRGC